MNNEANLMDWLEPPDHGLNDLKGRIARRTFRRKAFAGSTTLAIAGLATTAIFYAPIKSTSPDALNNHEWQAAISAQKERLRVINGAALELSDHGADTRIYLVSTTTKKDSAGPG